MPFLLAVLGTLSFFFGYYEGVGKLSQNSRPQNRPTDQFDATLSSLTCNFTWARIVDRNMMLAATKLLIKHAILCSTYICRDNRKLNNFVSVMCFAMRLVYVSI